MMVVGEDGSLYTEAASICSRILRVHEKIINKTWVHVVRGVEVVLLHVKPTEYNFEVVDIGDDQWMITCCNRELVEFNYDTNYIFGEPLEVMGMMSKFPKFNFLLATKNLKPDEVLILKRLHGEDY